MAVAAVAALLVGAVPIHAGVANHTLKQSWSSQGGQAISSVYLVQIKAGDSVEQEARLTETLVAARGIHTLSHRPTETLRLLQCLISTLV